MDTARNNVRKSNTPWRKSTYSAAGNCVEVAFRKSSFSESGNCVEVGKGDRDTIMVRDSKDTAQRPLTFNRGEWKAFVKGVKHGEFDIA